MLCCDALQGCESYEEVVELRDGLHEDVRWGDLEGTIRYLADHDWEGDWLDDDLVCVFVSKASAALENEGGGTS